VEHCAHDGFIDAFLHLLRDPAHWSFEILVSVVFLAIETVIFWPLIKRFKSHHRGDDQDIADLKQEVADLKKTVQLLKRLGDQTEEESHS
jgi:hypothetical protein